MPYNFVYNIDVLGKNYQAREISFIEYRNLVKNISTSDVDTIANAFETLLDTILLADYKINLQQKFLILLKYRELILGKNIEFVANNVKISYSIDTIFDFFNVEVIPFEYECNDNIYKFLFPTKLTPHTDVFLNVVDCISSINNYEVTDLTKKGIENFPALPVIDIYKRMTEHFELFIYDIKHIDYTISFFNTSALLLLKAIFSYSLQNFYDIEYSLRRCLNFNAADFNQYSYPECNLMLKLYMKEMADKENSSKVESSV